MFVARSHMANENRLRSAKLLGSAALNGFSDFFWLFSQCQVSKNIKAKHCELEKAFKSFVKAF